MLLQLPSYFVWFGWLTSKNTFIFFLFFNIIFFLPLFLNYIIIFFKSHSMCIQTEQNRITIKSSSSSWLAAAAVGMLIYEAYQMRKYYNVYMIYCDLITKTTLQYYLCLARFSFLLYTFLCRRNITSVVWLLYVVTFLIWIF